MGAPVMRWESSRQTFDCAVWSLSIYLGIPYDQVWQKVIQLDRSRAAKGLYSATIIRIGNELGHPLRKTKRVDDDSYGIIIVDQKKGDSHAAVLRNGLVFDTDQTVWEMASWLLHFRFTVEHLLTED